MIIFSLFFLIYVSSYVLLRREYTQYREMDGCPSEGCESVTFPSDKSFLIYSPLILIDRFINHTEIYIENW